MIYESHSNVFLDLMNRKADLVAFVPMSRQTFVYAI